MLFHRQLSYVDWELGLYLPPETFLTILYKELTRVLLPLGALCIVALFGIRSLLRIVSNEVRIVENGLRVIDHQNGLKLQQQQHEAWFVDKTLVELESIRQRYHEYHQALHIDPLTGIFNRRAFDDVMEKLNTGSAPFALVLIDVDHFKRVNDTYGHQTGDVVLQHVASTIMRVLGQGYRIGEDEFAALLLMDRNELAENLEHLITQVRNLSVQGTACKVTLSIGVAIGPDSQLFQKADAALYYRKAAGRDGWTL
nr:GGDEF domain-containing protein [Citrobacter sp. NCU1]